MKTYQFYTGIISFLFWCCLSLLLTSPGFAQDISVATRLSQTLYEVETEFQIDVTVDLQNILTIGGTIYLQYDPTILVCKEVTTSAFLGAPETCDCEPIQPGVLRFDTTVAAFENATTSDAEEILVTVTFEVKAPVDATAIQLQQITQIFGSGMGNIVSVLDDSATQQITTYTPLLVTLKLPESDATLSEIYSFEWLIENSITAPIYLTLEFSQDRGETWNLIANTTIEPSGAYQWDTSTLSTGDDYLLRASVLNDYKQIERISSVFGIENEKPADLVVPEPSTYILLLIGLLGFLVMRKKN